MAESLKLIAGEGSAVRQEFAITSHGAILGGGKSADIAVQDSSAAARHCQIKYEDGRWVAINLHSDADTFVNDQKIEKAPLKPGDVLRIGESRFTVAMPDAPQSAAAEAPKPAPAAAGGLIAGFMDRVTGVAGLESIKGFSASAMFSEIFKKRTDVEIENYLLVGTESTTPDVKSVDVNWPRPWLFFKSLALLAVVYLGFAITYHLFPNANLLPGLIIMGSVAVPLSLLVFFFEVNVVRNVSFYQAVRLLILGSVVSLFLTLLGYQVTKMDDLFGPLGVALIEETGKAATLLLVINNLRYRWTLNGLLFGAIVGTGFAVFESAGYAAGYEPSGLKGILDEINLRGVLSPFGGHTLWTAVVGAALWRVRGDSKFAWGMLKDGRFLRAFGMAVAMHTIWDSPKVPETYWIKFIVLGLIAWALVLGYIQNGLNQVRQAAQGA